MSSFLVMVKRPLAVLGCVFRLNISRLGYGWPVHVRVTAYAQATHIAPVVTIRMPMGQIVMSLLRGVVPASLTDRMAVEEQPISFLTAVRFARPGFGTPRAGVAHFIFPFTGDYQSSLPFTGY